MTIILHIIKNDGYCHFCEYSPGSQNPLSLMTDTTSGYHRTMTACTQWVYNDVYTVTVSPTWGDIGPAVIKALAALDRKKLYCQKIGLHRTCFLWLVLDFLSLTLSRRESPATISNILAIPVFWTAEHSTKAEALSSLHKLRPSSSLTWLRLFSHLRSECVATSTIGSWGLMFRTIGNQNDLTLWNESLSTTL